MNVLALLRPTSGVMPTLAPGGKTGSAANAEEKTVELAATIRATAAKDRRSFMKDLPGLHGGRSVGPSMPLGISGEILETILEPWGTTGVVPAGSLLAVLMSLQQGRVGVRSTVPFRYVGHFAGLCPLSGRFSRRFQRPNTTSVATAAGYRPGRKNADSVRNASLLRAMSGPKCRPCRFLNGACGAGPARPRLTQSFKRQPFQALSLRSVLA